MNLIIFSELLAGNIESRFESETKIKKKKNQSSCQSLNLELEVHSAVSCRYLIGSMKGYFRNEFKVYLIKYTLYF